MKGSHENDGISWGAAMLALVVLGGVSTDAFAQLPALPVDFAPRHTPVRYTVYLDAGSGRGDIDQLKLQGLRLVYNLNYENISGWRLSAGLGRLDQPNGGDRLAAAFGVARNIELHGLFSAGLQAGAGAVDRNGRGLQVDLPFGLGGGLWVPKILELVKPGAGGELQLWVAPRGHARITDRKKVNLGGGGTIGSRLTFPFSLGLHVSADWLWIDDPFTNDGILERAISFGLHYQR